MLRPASLADDPWVRTLFAEHLTELGLTPNPEMDRDMADFVATYTAPQGHFCVAVNPQGAGLAMGGILDGTIRRIHVVQHFRHLGLGRRIVIHLCEWAWEHGLTVVRAFVARANLPSQRLFANCGFSPAGQWPHPCGPTTCDLWERSKQLSQYEISTIQLR